KPARDRFGWSGVGGRTDVGCGACCGICLSRMLDLCTCVSPHRAHGADRALQRGNGELMKDFPNGKRLLAVLPLVFTGGLVAYKTRTSLAVLRTVWSTGIINARAEVVSFGQQAAAVDALHRSLNYVLVIWPALVFGILISAAVRAYVPADM